MRFVTASIVVCGFAAVLTGCNSTDRAAALAPAEDVITGSVATANRVDPKDAEIIKNRVVSSPLTAFAAPLRWENEETGASGAIMAIETYKGRHGQPCRSFRTTIANFLGVSLFEGETCEVKQRSWILSWLKRFD